MAKYDPLEVYLKDLDVLEWAASFADVERVLGFKLPASAYQYPAWWSNGSGPQHSHSASWRNAGWKTMGLDLDRQVVTFRKANKWSSAPSQRQALAENTGLTIQQAKAGLARTFGVSPDAIEITIKA